MMGPTDCAAFCTSCGVPNSVTTSPGITMVAGTIGTGVPARISATAYTPCLNSCDRLSRMSFTLRFRYWLLEMATSRRTITTSMPSAPCSSSPTEAPSATTAARRPTSKMMSPASSARLPSTPTIAFLRCMRSTVTVPPLAVALASSSATVRPAWPTRKMRPTRSGTAGDSPVPYTRTPLSSSCSAWIASSRILRPVSHCSTFTHMMMAPKEPKI